MKTDDPTLPEEREEEEAAADTEAEDTDMPEADEESSEKSEKEERDEGDEADEKLEADEEEKDEAVDSKGSVTFRMSKKRIWIIGSILLVAVLAILTWQLRWYQPVYNSFNQGTVAIKIKEGEKFAVEGAIVTVNGKSYTTDANGKISIDKLVAGSYKVTVSKDGYESTEQTITVKRGTNDVAQISLTKIPEKLFVLSGFVQDYVSGANLVDVQVTTGNKTKPTNPSGEFTFDNLPAGDHKLILSKSRYRDQEVTVNIKDADISGQQVQLVPVGQLIFVSNRDGKRSLYVTNYDGSEQRQFVTPENQGEDYGPQISPDNKWVIFSSTRDQVKSTYGKALARLYIVSREGKDVKKINDDVSHSEVKWSSNSRFLYYLAYTTPQENQTVRRFYDTTKGTTQDLGEDSVNELNFSAEGNRVVYTVSRYGENGSAEYTNYLKTYNLVTGERKTLVTKTGNTFSAPTFSSNGESVYYEVIVDTSRKRYEVKLSDSSEKETTLPPQESRTYYSSPDGTLKAFVEKRDGKKDLYIVDKDGKNEKRLTTVGVVNERIPVVWDETGRYLTYALSREGENAMYIVAVTGGTSPKVTDFSDSSDYPEYY